MKRYVLSKLASTDFLEIRAYSVQRWGRARAKRYMSALRAAFERAAKRPDRSAAAVLPGYRRMKAGRHDIYYRELADGRIEVVRILHETRDPGLHL